MINCKNKKVIVKYRKSKKINMQGVVLKNARYTNKKRESACF